MSEQNYKQKAQRRYHSQAGDVYEKMWFMVTALSLYENEQKNDFKVISNEVKAGKFDDVVWKVGNTEKYNFLQAKHSLNSDKKITFKDLLSKNKSFYDLNKYFKSYHNVMKKNYIENEIEFLFIVTNLNFDTEIINNYVEKPEEIILLNEFINENDNSSINKFYKFSTDFHHKLKESLSEQEQSFPKIDNGIKEFLQKLRFGANFSLECLGNKINRYLNNKLNLNANYEFCPQIYVELIEGENKILHRQSVTKIKNKLYKQNRLLIYYPENLQYFNLSENLMLNEIKFKNATLEELNKFKEFLNSSNTQIFNIITEQKELTSLKIYQYLLKIQKDSFIIINFRDILNQFFQDEAFCYSEDVNLLIIVCDDNFDSNVYEVLKKILQNNSMKKKIVLITNQNNQLPIMIKNESRYIVSEDVDHKITLKELESDSQDSLLNKKLIKFQGIEVKLESLVPDNLKHLINNNILLKLIKGEHINIANEIEKFTREDVRPLISRTLCLQIKINDNFQNENSTYLIIRNFNEKYIRDILEDTDIVLLSETDKDFNKLREKYSKHNIHWIKETNNEFIWQKSHGNSSMPGMERSTFLTSLTLELEKLYKSSWIIKLNLVDYLIEFHELNKNNKKIDETEIVRFLYKCAGLNNTQNILSSITVKDSKINLEMDKIKIDDIELLEIELFKTYYDNGNIYLLCDGFDEIFTYFKDKLIEWLKVLIETNIKCIWVTTSPNGF